MIEIYGKPACPQCEEAKTICEIRELSYTYLEVDRDFSREQLFEQFPQARTFPQIKVNGAVVGSISDFKDYIEQTYIGSTEGRL